MAAGWALDFPQYSRGAYQPAERAARSWRAGVWQGTITPPWEWRATQGAGARVTAAAGPPNPACRIKGNVSASGQKVSHAPGQQDYEAVRIDAGRGERWFCSLAEARAAGWRPAAR